MAKKRILFITLIFFLGTLGTGLCLTFSAKVTPNGCPTKGSSSRDSEDCFSHCAKQKIYAIKIDGSLREDPKIRTPLFLENKFSSDAQNYLFNSPLTTNYYLNQTITKLNISQIYFLAIFNHAPPLSF